MVTINPSTVTVVEAGQPASVLTTINWSASPLNLPAGGGTVTFTMQALDQNGNPMAGITKSIFENTTNQVIGTFPATNSNGMSTFTLTFPANTSTSQESYSFSLQ